MHFYVPVFLVCYLCIYFEIVTKKVIILFFTWRSTPHLTVCMFSLPLSETSLVFQFASWLLQVSKSVHFYSVSNCLHFIIEDEKLRMKNGATLLELASRLVNQVSPASVAQDSGKWQYLVWGRTESSLSWSLALEGNVSRGREGGEVRVWGWRQGPDLRGEAKGSHGWGAGGEAGWFSIGLGPINATGLCHTHPSGPAGLGWDFLFKSLCSPQ